ncbi:MAG: hypothetical protein AAF393_12420 [Pseudomonadota bacterium]
MLYLIVASVFGGFLLLIALGLVVLALGQGRLQEETVIGLVIIAIVVPLSLWTLVRQWIATLRKRARTALDRKLVIASCLIAIGLAIFTFVAAARDAFTVGLPMLIFAISLAAASYTSETQEEP